MRCEEARTNLTDLANAKPERVAVIYNPIRITEEFRRRVESELERGGWTETLWLQTSKEDAGMAMTAQAVKEEVDVVLGIGGDGTIRMITDGLAGTGIPLGLIPAGTGNLLARNLKLPLDHVELLLEVIHLEQRYVFPIEHHG